MTYNISRRKADSFICSLKLENPRSCRLPGFSIPMLKKRKTRSWWLRVFRFFELMEHLIIFYVLDYNLLRLRSQIIISGDKIEHMCYNMFVASSWARKGVSLLESIFSFIISVVAGIVANYICKWLDGVQKKGNQPKQD